VEGGSVCVCRAAGAYPGSETPPRVRTLLSTAAQRTLRLVVAEALPPRPRRALFRPRHRDMCGA
jgi:hypothetical protein